MSPPGTLRAPRRVHLVDYRERLATLAANTPAE
jgi:hypothetical protein